jgi:hypothetical protein
VAAALLLAVRPWAPESPAIGPEGPPPAGVARVPLDGPAPHTILVQFRLEAPGARAVRLAGDFTDWQPEHTMHEQAPGVWSVTVPLTPGVHDYVFVVDEVDWRTDPHAPQVADGFGGLNSRLAVLGPEPGERT